MLRRSKTGGSWVSTQNLLSTHFLFTVYQFGFRKNHSTSLALIDVVDNIYENLDASLTVVGMCLDLTKAFDTVNMIYYLLNYGIRGLAY